MVRNEDGLELSNFSGLPFPYHLVFLTLCWLLLLCFLCSDFWPLLHLNVDILKGSALRSLPFSIHTHYLVISFKLMALNIIWKPTSPRFMYLPRTHLWPLNSSFQLAYLTSSFWCLIGISNLAFVTLKSCFFSIYYVNFFSCRNANTIL